MFIRHTLTLSDDLKKVDKTFKETIDFPKKQIPSLLFDRSKLFFIMTIMDILNHFNLRLCNVGIIHQKLQEIVGQIKTLITSFLLF